jgi:hypothetical protein
MKITNFILFLLLILVAGCSKSTNELTPEFEFSVNGTPVEKTFTVASRAGHHIHLGSDADDTQFLVSFDESGNFGKMVYVYNEPITGAIKRFTSFNDFSSNYFDFQLQSYDQQNKWVRVAFSGYVYYNPFDLTSESKFVEGNFYLPFKDYLPALTNVGNEAIVNGNYWRSTNRYQKRLSENFNNITLHTMSDDTYKIMITFNDNSSSGTMPGIYNFTGSSVINKVQIAKFDATTETYTFYNCTGTLNVAVKEYRYVQGTYSFTGVNPSNPDDMITVQNGSFKLNYDLFH